MGIGAVGGITSPIYNPYIYNSRGVSAASLNPIGAIPEDSTVGGADYSGLVKNTEQVNINPLAKGQTNNFADVLMQQMSMSAVKREELLATNPVIA